MTLKKMHVKSNSQDMIIVGLILDSSLHIQQNNYDMHIKEFI